MSPLEAVVAAARAGSAESWPVGPIDAVAAARFATASGDSLALAGVAGAQPIAPALFLTSVLDWGVGTAPAELRPDGLSQREAPYVGAHDVRLVHGGQSLRWYRPVRVGESGLVATRVVRRAEIRRGRSGELVLLELESRFVSPSHGPVARCVETVICVPHREPRDPPDGTDGASRREIPPDRPADAEDTFDAVRLLRFSAATWNSHRIHVDAEFARGEGFDGVVVQSSLHGVMLLRAACAFAAAAAVDHGEPIALEWRNLAPAVAGQRLRAAVTTSTPFGSGGLETDVVEWNDAGVVTARGAVRFASDG